MSEEFKELMCVAKEFNKWLEYMTEKYKLDKDDIQSLVKQFLI